MEFGFVGPSYEAANPLQDMQRLINWYVEIDRAKDAKSPIALLGTPGLETILSTIFGEVRGGWVLPGNTSALVVVSNIVYLLSVSTPATSISKATFALTQIGTILSYTGQVSIRDNGVGGVAVIVDGTTNGYVYKVSTKALTQINDPAFYGSDRVSFIDGWLVFNKPGTQIFYTSPLYWSGVPITLNNVQITDTAGDFTCNAYDGVLSVGMKITVSGTLTGTGSINGYSNPTTYQISATNGSTSFTLQTLTGGALTTTAGTTTGLTFQTGNSFDATYYALKDSSSDNLITHQENNRELWLLGERTSEVWYDAGGNYFPFSRLQGATLQYGCSAKHSLARLGNGSLIWLGRNETGENIVLMSQGYQAFPVSTPAVANAICGYPVISDAIGYTYIEDGHQFYMLTFPTADVTWCYDIATEMWHQRASYDPLLGQFHRHRSNCLLNLANQRIVGDYQNGNLYVMSRTVYQDGSNPLVAVRRTPHLWNDRKRVRISALQVEFMAGQGVQSGQGINPQAVLRISRDGGQTWGSEKWAPMGKAGATLNRCMWRKLGIARDAVFEVTVSDPVRRDVVGATLTAESALT